MGTVQSHKDTQKRVSTKTPRCSLCKREYTPACDYLQGRCPHHPGLIDQILSKPYQSRFYNLIKFFTRKSK
jgi:hypothetical protein